MVTDVLEDPVARRAVAWPAASSLASFSRQQELEADADRRRHHRPGRLRPLWRRRASSPRWAATARCATRRSASDRAGADAIDFLSSHPSTPERLSIAITDARQYRRPREIGERDRDGYLAAHRRPDLRRRSAARAIVRGRRFIHPKLGFTFTAPGRLLAGEHRPGGARRLAPAGARRCGSTRRGSAAPTICRLPRLRLDRGRRDRHDREPDRERLPRRHRGGARQASGRSGSSPSASAARSTASSSRRGSLTPEVDRSFRAAVESFRRVEPGGGRRCRPLRLQIVTAQPGETRGELRRPHGPARPAAGAVPGAERPRPRQAAAARPEGQDRRWSDEAPGQAAPSVRERRHGVRACAASGRGVERVAQLLDARGSRSGGRAPWRCRAARRAPPASRASSTSRRSRRMRISRSDSTASAARSQFRRRSLSISSPTVSSGQRAVVDQEVLPLGRPRRCRRSDIGALSDMSGPDSRASISATSLDRDADAPRRCSGELGGRDVLRRAGRSGRAAGAG